MKVVCAGDRFITAAALEAAMRDAWDGPLEVRHYATGWPDEPWLDPDGVREASGDPEELARLVGDADAILTHLAPISKTVLAAAPRLRVVGVTRGGPVNVDLPAATGQHVPVVFLPGRNLSAVAEFTIGVMITVPRSIARAARSLSTGQWDARYFRIDETGPELRAATVGLVGLGAVGRRVAELLAAFGGRVLAADPYADPATVSHAELVPLRRLLTESDIVSVHARLTDDTHRMFDAAAFAAMKPGAYFVNTARGELVDRAALLAALESGRLAGAALDVFDPEPPAADDPLLRRPDVVATPHLAGASRQVAHDSVARIAAEVAGFLRDGTLDHCANPGWATGG